MEACHFFNGLGRLPLKISEPIRSITPTPGEQRFFKNRPKTWRLRLSIQTHSAMLRVDVHFKKNKLIKTDLSWDIPYPHLGSGNTKQGNTKAAFMSQHQGHRLLSFATYLHTSLLSSSWFSLRKALEPKPIELVWSLLEESVNENLKGELFCFPSFRWALSPMISRYTILTCQMPDVVLLLWVSSCMQVTATNRCNLHEQSMFISIRFILSMWLVTSGYCLAVSRSCQDLLSPPTFFPKSTIWPRSWPRDHLPLVIVALWPPFEPRAHPRWVSQAKGSGRTDRTRKDLPLQVWEKKQKKGETSPYHKHSWVENVLNILFLCS